MTLKDDEYTSEGMASIIAKIQNLENKFDKKTEEKKKERGVSTNWMKEMVEQMKRDNELRQKNGTQNGKVKKSRMTKEIRYSRPRENGKSTRERVNENIRLLACNVAGTRSPTQDDWNYIRKFDIICLTESWAGKKDRKWIDKTILGNRYEYRDAIKQKKREGRTEEELITGKMKINNEKWVVIGTYMYKEKDKNWKRIEEECEKHREEEIVIIGDLNARTGTRGGDLSAEEDRNSKDREINKGHNFLDEIGKQGLMIMNGAIEGVVRFTYYVNQTRDEWGEYTYLGPRGNTVIDYAITNEKGRDEIKSMRIGSSVKSDHLFVEIELNQKGEEEHEEEKGIIQKYERSLERWEELE
ncbi:hypothetical protein QAD02_013982 [Eretmocerus hayati]|uniref:Uncharacterized protein n=1 Tax=Eretmocerus hayati TaxID=131215 RepID=A0ACC2P8T9_9HYME|nr:hypothetical protein QAD02_013982 [Eretmocerus hayati]